VTAKPAVADQGRPRPRRSVQQVITAAGIAVTGAAAIGAAVTGAAGKTKHSEKPGFPEAGLVFSLVDGAAASLAAALAEQVAAISDRAFAGEDPHQRGALGLRPADAVRPAMETDAASLRDHHQIGRKLRCVGRERYARTGPCAPRRTIISAAERSVFMATSRSRWMDLELRRVAERRLVQRFVLLGGESVVVVLLPRSRSA